MAALPDSTTVLIVGAGPTGLATALSLHHRGFRDFVIVDAVSQGNNTSRALAIHAASLEALDTIGCGESIVSLAMKVTEVQIRTRSSRLIRPDFSHLMLRTHHPYAILIPQNLTEDVLANKLAGLGVTVHRPLKVVGMTCNTKNTQLTNITFEDGRMITAKYVIGADGARSLVRTTAGVNFIDPMNEGAEKRTNLAQMVLADVTFDTPYEDDQFETTLSPGGIFLCALLPSTYNEYLMANGHPSLNGRLYRIGSGVPPEDGEAPHPPSKEYLQHLVDRFGPYGLSSDPSVNSRSKPIRIKDVFWSTRFRNHAAIAETFFTRLGGPGGGAILLVGDAAHIHSPAGGQGMNLGLRDAVFLGEMLMKHMHATETRGLSEADKILQDFAAARRDRALEVIRLTKGMTTIMGAKCKKWVYWWLPIRTTTVRNWTLWLMGMLPFMRRRMAWELSGLGRR